MLPLYVTIKKFSELTGYSQGAVRKKIERGEWLQGVVFIRAPDHRILINLEGYQLWAEKNLALHAALKPFQKHRMS